jgi:RimJ/RimL family protein N-acetyltransferase
MAITPVRATRRLWMRPFRAEDAGWFAAMNADPRVMRHFPGVLDRDGSDRFLGRIIEGWADRGWGLWAVGARIDDGAGGEPFGFVGLHPASVVGPDAVEVGWRLQHRVWGQGFAPEGAREALRYAFDVLGLDEVVSFTVPGNHNSRRVMAKIGLVHDPARDFDHPGIDASSHPSLVRHVLYVGRRGERTGPSLP